MARDPDGPGGWLSGGVADSSPTLSPGRAGLGWGQGGQGIAPASLLGWPLASRSLVFGGKAKWNAAGGCVSLNLDL